MISNGRTDILIKNTYFYIINFSRAPLLNTAICGTGSINQSGNFLMVLYYIVLFNGNCYSSLQIKEIIGKNIFRILFALLIGCLFLGYSPVFYIHNKLSGQAKKRRQLNIKQGLEILK